ncbi:hypothetical protein F8154_10635 [Alkaliphilus pronyensis]|uniref:Flavodoxin domain-containing protein n=1 Tax=Alkaliphilus pronyensis TaxID=1482732 RepID=A0A6I0F6Q0_9FIRM|nr:flavodoxin domain-containing protein [Alkaliphilus pronyensis]KAB3533450.1 hypothetical protein F8154_10635 [Alkaliphilus pronyensis]
MKTIVIYKSKTGFTKMYAEWIGEELNCDISSYENFPLSTIAEYDCVIYGSRVHAGKVDGIKEIKELFVGCITTKLVVFATGGTPLEAKDVINKIWQRVFSEKELKTIPHFYMQSGLNYKKMSFGDRTIMKTLAKILGRKKIKNSAETGCEKAIANSYDISSRKYIVPLVEFVKEQAKIL